MPVMTSDGQGIEVAVADLLADRVVAGIEVCLNLEASLGGGGGDELDHGAVGGERLASPVHGDEREEAVLDLYLHRARNWPCAVRVSSSLTCLRRGRAKSRRAAPCPELAGEGFMELAVLGLQFAVAGP